MRPGASLLLSALMFVALHPESAAACPETLVPLDGTDPVFLSAAWKAPLADWKAARHARALEGFRKVGRKFEADAKRLFQAGPKGTTAKNADIQRFLEKTVYASPATLVMVGDRFSFPLPVLWAWADAACRENSLLEAATALTKLGGLRTGADVSAHWLALALRRNQWDRAEALLKELPPDGFLTPFAEGRLALSRGEVEVAREKLDRAKLAAILPERSKLVAALLAMLPPKPAAP